MAPIGIMALQGDNSRRRSADLNLVVAPYPGPLAAIGSTACVLTMSDI
jgi:hypothetical protein